MPTKPFHKDAIMGSNGKHLSNMITVLDVGSAKTVALICEATEAGLKYRGHGMVESRGSRKGIIVELEKAVQSIHKAVEEAEKLAGCQVGNAVISVAGSHIKGVASRGGGTVVSGARDVAREGICTGVGEGRLETVSA